MDIANLKIVIENPKGSYKSFRSSNHPEYDSYPLAGVTYPVDYGYIEGYESEDGEDLDIFRGNGDVYGFMRMWRLDTPEETKFIMQTTKEEFDEIIEIFKPVLLEHKSLKKDQFLEELKKFESK